MPYSIETKDDPVIEDKTPKFDGGMDSYSRATVLKDNQFVLGQNVDSTIEGRLITRRGTETAATAFAHLLLGLGFFQTEAAVTYTANLVSVCSDGSNGRFKIWDGATWQSPTSPFAYGTTAPVMMAQGSDKLYIAQSGKQLTAFNGTAMVTSLGTPPTNPTLCCWHTDRLMCAGIPGDPENLSMSQFFDGATWDHTNWDVGIGDGDGDPIVAIIPWTNFNLAVLKSHSIWMINCNPQLAGPSTGNISTFPVTTVHRQIGCIAPRSAVQVGADILFLSDTGVRGVARTLASEQQNFVGPPISEPITDIIKRVNTAAYNTIVGFNWDDRYLLALPLDSATQPNYIVVYNTLTQSWSGYWTGLQPTCFTRRIHSGFAKLCIGQADGKVTDFMDYVLESNEVTATYQDVTVDYPTTIVSRGFTCGDEDSPKTGLFARTEFNKSSATVTISAIPDGGTAQTAETFSTSSTEVDLPIDLPFDLPAGGILPKSVDLQRFGQWNRMQVKIASTAGKVSLNRVGVGAFMDSFVIQQ